MPRNLTLEITFDLDQPTFWKQEEGDESPLMDGTQLAVILRQLADDLGTRGWPDYHFSGLTADELLEKGGDLYHPQDVNLILGMMSVKEYPDAD